MAAGEILFAMLTLRGVECSWALGVHKANTSPDARRSGCVVATLGEGYKSPGGGLAALRDRLRLEVLNL